MSPLPNTRVIPLGWAEHHRPAAAGTRTTQGQLMRSNGQPIPYPLPEGWTGADQVWQGTVRVQQSNWATDPVPGLQPTQLRRYLITADVYVLQDIRVGEDGDIMVVGGRQYRVHQALHGSLLWEADLYCIDNQTQQQ